jgi:transposase
MDVITERVAGLDVHKDSIVACVLSGAPAGPVEREVRTFGTTTRELLNLREWLEQQAVTTVALEATGIYWRPIFNILQHDTPLSGEAAGVELILANPQHIKHVPGRKTDVLDAEWIAQLARHGLIAASFVPPRPIRELRDLARYRKKLVGELAAEKTRAQRVLEDANIKLGSVASDIFGVSGRAMLQAIVAGETDGPQLATRAQRKLRRKQAALGEALEGRLTAAHRFLLAQMLEHVAFLERAIVAVEAELATRLAAHEGAVRNLCTIPGVSLIVATALIAELGLDMSVFPSAQQVASWAGVAPGSFESAGKKRGARVLKGRTWLKSLLCEAAWGAVRTKGSYLAAKFFKLRARRGPQRALMAIAHKILVIAYQILRTGATYRELGGDYLDRLHLERRRASLVSALETLGFDVTLTPKPLAGPAHAHAAG